ncbi:hypothetical protein OHU17_16955 [Streptomyces goshikiensis]|uniref:DUF3077 domain-containing protein n=1 Tax=Streptomyces goshikiensis TaxID=1942 RepID=A0ABZ1RLT1_9ACTN|nr:hypothetical protein [Streptomyces goshikiensis]
MTSTNELRLLPWSGPDDKPCFLSTDNSDGFLSRRADNTEEAQLKAASALLDHVIAVLTDPEKDPDELHLVATDLTTALRATLRVATSRGHRLPSPAQGGEGEHTPRRSMPLG